MLGVPTSVEHPVCLSKFFKKETPTSIRSGVAYSNGLEAKFLFLCSPLSYLLFTFEVQQPGFITFLKERLVATCAEQNKACVFMSLCFKRLNINLVTS